MRPIQHLSLLPVEIRIAGLWSEQAVGIVGGEPKCCRSFLVEAVQAHEGIRG